MIANAVQSPLLAMLFLLASLGGTALLLIGLAYYSKAKGHTPWWGLVGLLSFVGILVLALLPDRLQAPTLDVASIDDLDIPDGTQSPFGSRYKSEEPSER